MNLSALQLLLDVARRGSFAAAARTHGLDPSAVSRSIALIEAELGIRLFQRTTRRLSPTEAGAVYLTRAEAVVDELERAREEARAVSATPSGTLRLTASVTFAQVCIVPLLQRFRATFPSVRLELLMTDANLDLVAERIDLAVRLAPRITTDVIGAKLMDTCYRVCASPSYAAAAPTLDRPEALSRHDCLRLALPAYRSHWRFRDTDGVVSEVPVDGSVVLSNPLGVRDAAIAGLGPALLPDWLIDDEIGAGRLVDLFPGYDVTATSFDTAAWLLYPSRSFLPEKVRVTIDFLRRHLPPRPGTPTAAP